MVSFKVIIVPPFVSLPSIHPSEQSSQRRTEVQYTAFLAPYKQAHIATNYSVIQPDDDDDDATVCTALLLFSDKGLLGPKLLCKIRSASALPLRSGWVWGILMEVSRSHQLGEGISCTRLYWSFNRVYRGDEVIRACVRGGNHGADRQLTTCSRERV